MTSIARPDLRDAAFEALQQLRALLEPIVEERRRNPGSDLVSDLARAEYDGEPFPFEEIVATVAFLLTAGVETTERVLSSLFRYMALHPDQWEAVRARRDDRNFLLSLSAEALRYFPPVHGLTRGVASEVTLHGVTIPPGERLMVSLASANRDEDHFERAQDFGRGPLAGERPAAVPRRREDPSVRRGPAPLRGLAAGVEMLHGIRELVDRVAVSEPDGALPEAEGFMLNSPMRLPVTLRAA